MSTDSSERFAALELDINPVAPVRTKSYTVPPPPAEVINISKPGYNISNGHNSLASVLNAIPELAGEVTKEQLYTLDGCAVPDAYATIRAHAGKRTALGVVGKRYTVVQDSEAFDMVNALMDTGAITSLNAGAYKAKTWVYGEATASTVEIVKGDPITRRVLFGNSHDGSIPWSVGMPGNRVVCQNTFHLAMSSKLSKLLKLRHSGNVIEQISQVHEAIELAGMEFINQADQFKFMASKPCTDDQLKEYTGYVFSKWADAEDDTEQLDNAGGRVYARVLENYQGGAGSELSRGTVWGAFNAVTEYMTHQRGRGTEQARFADLNWGNGANLNRRALDGALSMAQGA